MSDQKCQEEYIGRIHKVQDYIEHHLGQSLSIEELSSAAGFSKYHFSRIFQAMLHEPLAHYVNRIRMESALFLLAHRADKTTLLCEVYECLQVTAGFLRILNSIYGMYFKTPFWELPEDIRNEVIYGNYDNGKQIYCLERILRNAYERDEDVENVYVRTICPDCHGHRIGQEARKVFLNGKQIGDLGQMTLTSLLDFLNGIPEKELSQFVKNVVKNVTEKIKHLIQFRLGHLTLYREMASLSGGEVQRIFLHLHLESRLDSLIYVFDEPMAGLHPSEKQSMIEGIKELRDLGNTVIVVEHDKDMIRHADHIIEIGPKAGVEGGTVVYQGDYEEYKKADTLLSKYLFGKHFMPQRKIRTHKFDKQECFTLKHANTHYLKDLTVAFPLHAMVGIAGLSGSGKSSMIEETLLKRLVSSRKYGYATDIEGVERISGFVKISQEPIGRSASSTPASYIGIWDKIRELFSKQPEAKIRNNFGRRFNSHQSTFWVRATHIYRGWET